MADDRPQTTSSSHAVGFAELGLPKALVDALAKAGVTTPFPIQTATVPDALAGMDVLGKGRTGSGKTFAFALPVLARLAASKTPRRPRKPRALILAPTRELASQIETSVTPFARALGLRTLTVFGGVRPNPQIDGLRKGVDLLIACPGRLSDHVQSRNALLDEVEITVLDEADHMTDLGFLPVVKKLLDKTPQDSQRLLFSATLDGDVDTLVRDYLTDPITHSVAEADEQGAELTHHLLKVRKADRLAVLAELSSAPGRNVVFTRTKHGATRLAKQLSAAGVNAVELHGDLPQSRRSRNLGEFSSGTANTLVATDIAARGIHVDEVALVIHADPPVEHKAYLHRSGRTGRAGASGTVVTLMTEQQVGHVGKLMRKAEISPETTETTPDHPILRTIAPGERTKREEPAKQEAPKQEAPRSERNRSPRKPNAQQRGPKAQGKPAGRGDAASHGNPAGHGKPAGRGKPAQGKPAGHGKPAARGKPNKQGNPNRQGTPKANNRAAKPRTHSR